MKTKRLFDSLLASVVATAVLGISLMAADQNPRRAAMQAFMRRKLTYSQGILEGLALEKFDLVSKNAVHLRDMTQSNTWLMLKQADYMKNLTNFQKSVGELYMAAVDKKLDESTEAYTRVARSCVECHRLVRFQQHQTPGGDTPK